MDYIDEYLDALKKVKEKLKHEGKKATDKGIAAELGVNPTYFSSKINGKEGEVSEFDVVWMKYKFGLPLEKPKNIEEVSKGGLGKNAGTNISSDQPDQRLKSLLAELRSSHKEALQKIDQALTLLPQVPGSESGTAEPIVKRRVQAFVNTAVGTDNTDTGTEGQKKK